MGQHGSNRDGRDGREGGRESRHARALTLLELLVVTAVATFLIVFVLPLRLHTDGCNAKQAKCLAQLMNVSKGSQTYAIEDPDNLIFPISPVFGTSQDGATQSGVRMPRRFEWGGKSGRGSTEDAADSEWGYAGGLHAFNRPLNKLLYKTGFVALDENASSKEIIQDQDLDLQIYRCPADVGFTVSNWPSVAKRMEKLKDSGLSCYDFYGNSYTGAPYLAWDDTADTSLSDSPALSATVFHRPLDQIPNPDDTILYFEANAMYAYDGVAPDHEDNLARLEVLDDGQVIQGWHGNGKDWFVNVNFVDGHSSVVKMHGRDAPPPRPQYGHPPYLMDYATYSTWWSFIVRGPGWQLDTLPAIPTELGFTLGQVQ